MMKMIVMLFMMMFIPISDNNGDEWNNLAVYFYLCPSVFAYIILVASLPPSAASLPPRRRAASW